MPKVSVIIPTYNRGNFIVSTIESVLSQSYRDFEVIVVDDGSTDDTRAQLEKFNHQIKYLYQQNQGVSATRNTGIRLAQGEYIAFLDSDDLWLADKLMIQTQILDNDPGIGLTYSRVVIQDENGIVRGMKPQKPSGSNFQELLEQGGDYPTSTVMVKKICFNQAGLFDEQFSILEDFDMWLRISRNYRTFAFTEKPLAIYRRHSENSILDELKVYEFQVKLYQKILANFPDTIRSAVPRKLAKNQYLLAKVQFERHHYFQAFNNLARTLKISPGVGMFFWTKQETPVGKIMKIIKPYLFLGWCFFKQLLNYSERSK